MHITQRNTTEAQVTLRYSLMSVVRPALRFNKTSFIQILEFRFDYLSQLSYLFIFCAIFQGEALFNFVFQNKIWAVNKSTAQGTQDSSEINGFNVTSQWNTSKHNQWTDMSEWLECPFRFDGALSPTNLKGEKSGVFQREN